MDNQDFDKLEKALDDEFRRMVEAEGGNYEEAKEAVEDALNTPTSTATMEDVVDFAYRVWKNRRGSADEETVRLFFGTFKKGVEQLAQRYREERQSGRAEKVRKARESAEWPEFID